MRSMRSARRFRMVCAVVLAVVACVVIAACGGSSKEKSSSSTSTTASSTQSTSSAQSTSTSSTTTPPVSTWSLPNADPDGTRDVASQINSSNVSKLKVAWSIPIKGVKGLYGVFASSPVVGPNGIVYLQDLGDNVYAVDVKTGHLVWEVQGARLGDQRRGAERGHAGERNDLRRDEQFCVRASGFDRRAVVEVIRAVDTEARSGHQYRPAGGRWQGVHGDLGSAARRCRVCA
jgi:hypothetical protein